MFWKTLKQWFTASGAQPAPGMDASQVEWLDPAHNPWGVPVLDVRPVTSGMVWASQSMQCAQNSVSFFGDDGSSFIGIAPSNANVTSAGLRYRIDRSLWDGALFTPESMDQKWAIYARDGRIIFIRSWLRKVEVGGDLATDGDFVEITTLHGTFTQSQEPPSQTVRIADFLVRSHALHLDFPAPVPAEMEHDPQKAAMWCCSMFGNKVLFATPYDLPSTPPEKILRTNSLLHIAAARNDEKAARKQLDAGVPIDLLAQDGSTPLHWAAATKRPGMVLFLIKCGSPVDVKSIDGATPLMTCVEVRSLDLVRCFLQQGAEPNATDARGFTALHRAAEMGELEIVQALLEKGATRVLQAEGYTPRSLAEKRGHTEISKLLA